MPAEVRFKKGSIVSWNHERIRRAEQNEVDMVSDLAERFGTDWSVQTLKVVRVSSHFTSRNESNVGDLVTVKDMKGEEYTCNSSFFKPVK